MLCNTLVAGCSNTNKMEFTGIAGQILGWLVLITAYTVVLLGLFIAWAWIFDKLLKKAILYMNAWGVIIEYAFDKQKYKRKLREIDESSTPQSEP